MRGDESRSVDRSVPRRRPPTDSERRRASRVERAEREERVKLYRSRVVQMGATIKRWDLSLIHI